MEDVNVYAYTCTCTLDCTCIYMYVCTYMYMYITCVILACTKRPVHVQCICALIHVVYAATQGNKPIDKRDDST